MKPITKTITQGTMETTIYPEVHSLAGELVLVVSLYTGGSVANRYTTTEPLKRRHKNLPR
jgi:hypothetical protein